MVGSDVPPTLCIGRAGTLCLAQPLATPSRSSSSGHRPSPPLVGCAQVTQRGAREEKRMQVRRTRLGGAPHSSRAQPRSFGKGEGTAIEGGERTKGSAVQPRSG